MVAVWTIVTVDWFDMFTATSRVMLTGVSKVMLTGIPKVMLTGVSKVMSTGVSSVMFADSVVSEIGALVVVVVDDLLLVVVGSDVVDANTTGAGHVAVYSTAES